MVTLLCLHLLPMPRPLTALSDCPAHYSHTWLGASYIIPFIKLYLARLSFNASLAASQYSQLISRPITRFAPRLSAALKAEPPPHVGSKRDVWSSTNISKKYRSIASGLVEGWISLLEGLAWASLFSRTRGISPRCMSNAVS